jgi:putative transposase
MASARVRRRDLVRQPHRLHLGNGAPRLHRLLVDDKHFLRRPSDGTWDRALAELHHPGPPCPRPQPRALGRGDRLLLDQSVTRSWSRGFDGAKKIDGIKRHVVVDTLGLLVAVLVTAASVQDRAAVPRLLG